MGGEALSLIVTPSCPSCPSYGCVGCAWCGPWSLLPSPDMVSVVSMVSVRSAKWNPSEAAMDAAAQDRPQPPRPPLRRPPAVALVLHSSVGLSPSAVALTCGRDEVDEWAESMQFEAIHGLDDDDGDEEDRGGGGGGGGSAPLLESQKRKGCPLLQSSLSWQSSLSSL